jgi:hypothetical protein
MIAPTGMAASVNMVMVCLTSSICVDALGPISQDDLFVSVPLMAANQDNVGEDGYPVPNMVEFSFYTGGPGTYFWNCEFPCGDGTYANFGGPMSAQGYMAGRITVK